MGRIVPQEKTKTAVSIVKNGKRFMPYIVTAAVKSVNRVAGLGKG